MRKIIALNILITFFDGLESILNPRILDVQECLNIVVGHLIEMDI